MTPPAAGRAALSILIAAAALPGLALGRPGTTSADTPTASSVAITGSAGTDNEYHTGDTITPTVTFSTAVAGHSSASRAIDVDGVDRSSTLDSTATGAPTVANAARCAAAFPARSHSHGCPDTAAADTNPGPGPGCELTRDLDFDDGAPGDRTDDSHYNSNAGWTPIANGSTRYIAIFEGNGHAIANLYINFTGLYAGLFGQLAPGGTIKEVGIADARVTGTSSSFLCAGALVGYNFGTITARYAAGAVASSGVDSNRPTNLGGLAAANINTITDSGTGAWRDVGGLLGAQDGTTIVSANYWDTNASRIADDADDLPPEGKTVAALPSPTGYTGIYAAWDDADVDGDGRPDRPWRFGDRCQYPALAIGGHCPSRQRANDPPGAAAEYVAPPIVYNLNIRFNVRGITLDEGQSTTYRVRMSEPPVGHPARVSITGNNPGVTVSPPELHFTAADYGRWQTVAVTALQDANNTVASASLAHRGPSYSCGAIIASVSDTRPGAVAEQVNGHTVTMRHELEAPPGVTLTLTAPDTLDTDSDITIGGPPADAPNGAPGCGIGQSPPARMLAAIRVRGTPAAGLSICLPALAALLAEAGEHPLTLLRCANDVRTPVAGSERRDRGDGIAALLVCAAGVMEYGLFAVAYTLPQPGPVSNLAAAAGDTAGTITLTWTPGANAAAPWIAGVIQTEPYCLAIWQIAENPGSQAFTGLDSGASYIFTATAGRGEGDSSEWTPWAPWVSATPD